MEHERERLLAFQTWDSWVSDLLAISAIGYPLSGQNTPPPFHTETFDNEKMAPLLVSETQNNSAKRIKRLFKPPAVKASRSRPSSKIAKRIRSSSRSRSRKGCGKMLLTIHRITLDLEADTASSSEWNNCHASDADSDTDSIAYLHISELRSETDETLPRPHVSPPIPPNKLEKKHTSQVLPTSSKLAKKESTKEVLEVRESADRQGKVEETENLTNKGSSYEAKVENSEKKNGKEEGRKEEAKDEVEETKLNLKRSAKVLFSLNTQPSAEKTEELISQGLHELTTLGTEDYGIRRNAELTPRLSERDENDLPAQAFPHLARRWAHQGSIENPNRFFDFLVGDRNSLQEPQSTLDLVGDEEFFEVSEVKPGFSEAQSEWETIVQESMTERPLNEFTTRTVKHRSKKANANRNNNAVSGKGDVKSKSKGGTKATRQISTPFLVTKNRREPTYPHQSAPHLQRPKMTSEYMDDAISSPRRSAAGTKIPDSPESYWSSSTWFEPSAPFSCAIHCHQTPRSVESVRGKSLSQHTLKVVGSKLSKMKRRLPRRASSFKEQLEDYNKKGLPHRVEDLLSQIVDKYAMDIREYVQYLQVLRGKNNANRSWKSSAEQNNWGQWTQKEAREFEEFVCFISIDTADIDDIVLPFRVSISRHKLLTRAFKLCHQSSLMSNGNFVDYKDNWANAPHAPFVCHLPPDHPIRSMLRSSSGSQDRRIFAIENDISGRILLAEDKVIFVRGLPCFQVHILAPTAAAIGLALMQMEQRLPSLYAKLVITERLPTIHSQRGDKSVHAPTMGNFTTRFNYSPHLAPRITVTHVPLSATPEDRRDFASYHVNEDDPELEHIKMSQKFVDKLCTYR
ncbi:unnamed protein product [Hydatigera taeniaeformis]|uniref:Protein kinase domain-containing protein n=1 Tax=Hydatigena taeniaeformis TaxID=6205 RepID=A0A0R3X2M8_HYDTA|nr:unnamed protein product [Hydatigera taeniaeformis]